MELTDIDLTLENSESLEKPDELKRWARKYRTANIGLLLFLISGLSYLSGSLDSPGKVAMGWLGCGGLLLFIIFMPTTKSRGMMQKAPRNPEETVRRFYYATINVGNKVPSAYICLLNQAKSQFRGIDDFIEYYKEVFNNLRKDIFKCFGLKGSEGQIYRIKNISELSSEGKMKSYEVEIEARLTKNISTGSSPKGKVVEVMIRERCTVANINGRWYLTSGKWTGLLTEEIARAHEARLEEETYTVVGSMEEAINLANKGPVLLFTMKEKNRLTGIEELVMQNVGPQAHKAGITILWGYVGGDSDLGDYLKGKGIRKNGCILFKNGDVIKHRELPLLPVSIYEAYIKAAKQVLQGYC